MDIEKHLILLKGEDKTDKINRCVYEDGKYKVTFLQGKTYSYNYGNVQWFKNPVSLDSATNVVYKDKQPVSGVDKILDFEEYKRLCFVTGFKKVYHRNEITIEQSCLNNPDFSNCFGYLKKLADKIGVDDEEDRSFLSRQYSKLSSISPPSILAQYLSPATLSSAEYKQMPIFPIGFNLSQKSAAEKALNEQISVIEGPPGTGKTQTILNIIANAVINRKTVAVVSNNNSATANVLEKLQKYEVDFIAPYLGNVQNQANFFAEQKDIYPDMTSWELERSAYKAIEDKLDAKGQELDAMLEKQNRAAVLKQELAAFLVEKEHFATYFNESNEEIVPYRSLRRHSAATIMKLWLYYQQMAEKENQITWKFKLKNLLRFGIISFSFYEHYNEQVIDLLQKLYYDRKIEELNDEIQVLTKRLENFRFDRAMREYGDDSMKLFKAQLAERYKFDKKRPVFTKDALWKDFDSFIKEYPVILSTTHSLRNCASANYLFDYVVIDEASQVDIVTGALALSCARNAVIVGDLKQLPNIVPAHIAEETKQIFRGYSLPAAYDYAENSILSSMTKLYANIPRTLLQEHYRCHPKIIGFCNQKFYNNELIVLTEEADRDKPLAVYKTIAGNHARGNYNQRQIDVIMEEILPEQRVDSGQQSVGIISPYRMQRDKVIEAIGSRNFEVDTVHKYQGREKDIVIITTVVNKVTDFVDNPNLINVAVSRAVDKLIVVVSDNLKNDNSNIGDLIKYIEYNNFEVIDSQIYSVFDLLYHNYSGQLFERMKGRKKVSEFESENLINAVIEKVLGQDKFQNLDWIMHQPLKMLIRNPEKLHDNECKFAMNILTHTDFVIFNKLNKMPVLVVEVDGYAYHVNNPKQVARDEMKDAILEKYGIPILRLRTNESGEEARLSRKLGEVLVII
ncbi:MAG: AAA family ATPase [Clostridiaceae bacterium]|nr:AAA family ATPase [Clostridiaceae bacterium]